MRRPYAAAAATLTTCAFLWSLLEPAVGRWALAVAIVVGLWAGAYYIFRGPGE